MIVVNNTNIWSLKSKPSLFQLQIIKICVIMLEKLQPFL